MSSGVCLRFVGIFVFVRRFLVVAAAAQPTRSVGENHSRLSLVAISTRRTWKYNSTGKLYDNIPASN